MTTAPTELDAGTKARLADEVERLVRMGMDRKKARRLVWDDYLEELAAQSLPLPEPTPPAAVPVPVTAPAPAPTSTEETFFTPDRLAKSRAALAKVKQLVGLRR